MKKRILLLVIVIALVAYVLWPRSVSRMASIARDELEMNVPKSLLEHLEGPLITETANYSEFMWFKKLEWGESSKIFIKVYKSFNSCNRHDSWWRNFFCYLEPRVTMNHQWYYFLFPEGTSSFTEVFPSGYKGIKIRTSLISNVDSTLNGYELTVSTERIIRFLKAGYFEVMQNKNDTSIILFYEPVAYVYSDEKQDTIRLTAAKVFLNDTLGITLVPHQITD